MLRDERRVAGTVTSMRWVDVGSVDRLAPGLPVRVDVEGAEVVVWRLADGRLAALDDRCAHQEIRLSLGSVVDGCIVCAAHSWAFDRDGWSVPMGTSKVRTWLVRERDGRIEVDADAT